ncbi:MAG TPA: hypothetical protein VIJ06_01600 [Methylovirgula sp.]
MATFLAMDIRQTQPGEAKPGQRSFLRWLARTYIPTWGTQEDELSSATPATTGSPRPSIT